MKTVPSLVDRDVVAGCSGRRWRATPCGHSLGQRRQLRIAGARIGEAVLAQTHLLQLLAHFGRQALQRVSHELWRVAAQALDQVEWSLK
jgi:hypothetical protein